MIVLSCGVHDPDGGLLWMLEDQVLVLWGMFDDVVVTATKFTHPDVVKTLRRLGCRVMRRRGDGVGLTYRDVVRRAHDAHPRAFVFCVDLDRALHWARTRPAELARAAAFARKADWFVGERTPRAYRTHQRALIETEAPANRTLSRAVGEMRARDFLTSCMGFSPRAAAVVLSAPARRDVSFFGLWTLTLHAAGFRPSFLACEGLDWETPDQHQEAVRALGSVAAFRHSFDVPTEWEKRRQIAKEAVRDLGPEGD